MSLSSRLTSPGRFCRSVVRLSSAQQGNPQRCRLSTSASRNNNNDGDGDDLKPLKQNPYFDKYSNKISQLHKTTPDELLRRLASFQKNTVTGKSKEQSLDSSLSQRSTFTKTKNLDDIVRIELLKAKSPEDITDIWLRHHMTAKETFSIVISAEVYDIILRTSLEHPTFLLPLPRQSGYEYFVSQSCGHEFHLTPLINYHTFKENAPECLALTHFTELVNDKGVVLVRGEFNDDVLNVSEALCLANQLHRYYGTVDVQRNKVLQRFTNTPNEFQHMDLIVQLERMAE